jgi:hypothetical protein
LFDTTASIHDCYFAENKSQDEYSGGAIDCIGSGSPGTACVLEVVNTTFESNYAGQGGGIAIRGTAEADLTGCHFQGNSVFATYNPPEDGTGGGLWVGQDASCTVERSTFLDNWSLGSFSPFPASGGAVSGPAQLISCTFVDNGSMNIDEGAVAGTIEGATLDSCIVVGSTGGVLESPLVTYSLIEGGWPGGGNIDADPLLVAPWSGDFGLLPHSPCIDSGNPELAADSDGTRRDMGAVPWVWETISSSVCDSNPNSTGSAATMGVSGVASVAVDFVRMSATGLPADRSGFFLASQVQGFVPLFAGSEGNLCLDHPIVRINGPGQIVNSGTSSNVELIVPIQTLPGDNAVMAGETWYFQYWFRDIGPDHSSNTSNGVVVSFD